MSERVLRASDQDREEAILALADAFADGRLDHAEFETRMESAQDATYVHDLDPLFADLPARRRTDETARRELPGGPPRRRPSVAPFVVLAVLAGVLLAGGHLWLLIPLWILGFSLVRRLAWQRWSRAHPGLPQRPGPYGRRVDLSAQRR